MSISTFIPDIKDSGIRISICLLFASQFCLVLHNRQMGGYVSRVLLWWIIREWSVWFCFDIIYTEIRVETPHCCRICGQCEGCQRLSLLHNALRLVLSTRIHSCFIHFAIGVIVTTWSAASTIVWLWKEKWICNGVIYTRRPMDIVSKWNMHAWSGKCTMAAWCWAIVCQYLSCFYLLTMWLSLKAKMGWE